MQYCGRYLLHSWDKKKIDVKPIKSLIGQCSTLGLVGTISLLCCDHRTRTLGYARCVHRSLQLKCSPERRKLCSNSSHLIFDIEKMSSADKKNGASFCAIFINLFSCSIEQDFTIINTFFLIFILVRRGNLFLPQLAILLQKLSYTNFWTILFSNMNFFWQKFRAIFMNIVQTSLSSIKIWESSALKCHFVQQTIKNCVKSIFLSHQFAITNAQAIIDCKCFE